MSWRENMPSRIQLSQNGRHFADDIFKCLFLNENVSIPIKTSLKIVPKSPINNIPALVQIRAWRRPGDKPLSEPMMVSLLTHICVTRPQWVKYVVLICRWDPVMNVQMICWGLQHVSICVIPFRLQFHSSCSPISNTASYVCIYIYMHTLGICVSRLHSIAISNMIF